MSRLTHNWSLKLTALVLAIGLWSHVRGQVNPWEVATFKARLTAETPSGFVLQNSEKIPRYVTVTLRGPRLTLRSLKGVTPANPLSPAEDAPSVAPSRLRANLDFSSARRGEQKVAVKAQSTLDDIEVIGVKPSEFVIALDVAAQKKVAVQTQFDFPGTWRVSQTRLSADEVQVSGASQTLDRVQFVRARVESKINSPGAVEFDRVPLQAVDEDGEVVNGVKIEPDWLRVRTTVAEPLEEKWVAVKVRVRGKPAAGFTIDNVEVEPLRLRLRGSRRILAAIESVNAILDVSEARSNVIRRLRIAAPTGTEWVSSRRVLIRADIMANSDAIKAQNPTYNNERGRDDAAISSSVEKRGAEPPSELPVAEPDLEPGQP